MTGNKEIITVGISDLKAGMKLGENILNKYGNLFIPVDFILDEQAIERVKSISKEILIDVVKIYNESEEVIIHRVEIQKQKAESVEKVKDILKDIGRGKKIHVDKVRQVTEDLNVEILENFNFMGYLKVHPDVSEYLYTHSTNVCILSIMIGKWLNYDANNIKNLSYSAVLHDIGISKLGPELMLKKEGFTPQEEAQYKQHPSLGYDLVNGTISLSKNVAYGVLMHHERIDGHGYPMRITGEKIHEYAKIISVADIYDTMTSDTPLGSKKSPFEAFKAIDEESFTAFDGNVARTFLANMATLYVGDEVILSDGEKGTIVYINPQCVYRPLIKVGDSFLDLYKNKDIYIREMI